MNCRNGPNCSYFNNSSCAYYHPPQHYTRNTILPYYLSFPPNQRYYTQSFPYPQMTPNFIMNIPQSSINIESESVDNQTQQSTQSVASTSGSISIPEIWVRRNERIMVGSEITRSERRQCRRRYNNISQQQTEWFLNNTKKQIIKVQNTKGQKCTICQFQFQQRDEVIETFCLHRFHFNCSLKWFIINPDCPLCRKPFNQYQQYKSMEGYPIKEISQSRNPMRRQRYDYRDRRRQIDFRVFRQGRNQRNQIQRATQSQIDKQYAPKVKVKYVQKNKERVI